MYRFLDSRNTVLYVGKAVDLKSRVSSYFTSPAQLGERTRLLVSQIEKIQITLVESELEALLLEAFYIKKYNPKFNIRFTDNKAYILVRITVKDSYPKILLARKMENPEDIYFGPFPSSSAVKLVLKTIRRVFPYQSVENHPKRICLYNHLGLCPCPPLNDSPLLRKQYRLNIRSIIRIFEGQSQKIMSELEKEREELSREERFEEAGILQRRINALGYITQPIHRPHEYDFNPNLRSDLRDQEIESLKEILRVNGCSVDSLHRIECYDISHIQGSNTTASMVVFINGEKESSQYRKFRIQKRWLKGSSAKGETKDFQKLQVIDKLRGTQSNDFASMQEVLTRRFKHSEWDFPGLLIVDGGKGQVSAALDVLKGLHVSIPLIGLAKREETIIIPQIDKFQSSDKGHVENLKFIEVSLPKDSKALHLIMRIRDEAHRFALTYHQKLRSKATIQ